MTYIVQSSGKSLHFFPDMNLTRWQKLKNPDKRRLFSYLGDRLTLSGKTLSVSQKRGTSFSRFFPAATE